MFKKNGIIFREFSIKSFNDELKTIKDKILLPNDSFSHINEKDLKIFIFIIKHFGVQMIYNLNFISKKKIKLIINKTFSTKFFADQLSLLFVFIFSQKKSPKISSEEDNDIYERYFKLFYKNLYNLLDNIINAKYKDNQNNKKILDVEETYEIIRLNLFLGLNDLMNKSYIFNESIHYLVKIFFRNKDKLITQTKLNLILTQICASLLNSDINLYFLRRDRNLYNFSILEITKFLNFFRVEDNLNGLVGEILSLIYSNNYSSLINDYILDQIKNCFYKLKKDNIKNIVNYIKNLLGLVKFLNILFTKERDDKFDPYKPSSYFIFGKNKFSGINYNANNELLKKNFTLIFSFRINALNNNIIYPLISFVSSTGGNEIIFNISINNKKLQIYCQGDSKFQEIEEISANKSYLIIIEYKSMGILKDKIKICINGKKKEITSGNINYKAKCSLKIGFIPEEVKNINSILFKNIRYFDGIIGPIIQFSTTFDDKNFIENVLKLKRNYDILLLMNNNTNFDYCYNYEEYLSYLTYDINSAKYYFNGISKKISEDFQYSICPISMINNINQNTILFYQDIYGKNVKVNNKEIFPDFNTLCIPSSKSLGTYAKKDQKSLSAFVEYDGIHLYILIIEYFYNILRMLINNPREEKAEIANEMNNVLSYIIKAVFQMLYFFNLESFSDSLDSFGFSVTKLFNLLIDIQPLNEVLVDSIAEEGKSLLIHFNKIIDNPSSKIAINFLSKFVSLICSHKYFDISNYSKPENIFEFLNLALKNNHKLINKNILNELLSFSFILAPVSFKTNHSDEGINSLNKDCTNVQVQYKNLIGYFIENSYNLQFYVDFFQTLFNQNSRWNEKYELVEIYYKKHKVQFMYNNIKENKDSNKSLLNIFKKDKNNSKNISLEKELFNEYKRIFTKLIEISNLNDKKNEIIFEKLKSIFILLIYEHKMTIRLNIFNEKNKEHNNSQEKKNDNRRNTIKSEDNNIENLSFFSPFTIGQMKSKPINSLNSSPCIPKLGKFEELETSNDEFVLDFSCEDKEDNSQSFEIIENKSIIIANNYLFDAFLISKKFSFYTIKALFTCLFDNLEKETKLEFIKNPDKEAISFKFIFNKFNRSKKELFSQFLNLIEFINDESTLESSLRLIFSVICDCSSNISNKNNNEFFHHLFESRSMIKNLFHFSLNNDIITNQEFKRYIINNIKLINNNALLYHPKPYIFSLIKTCFQSGYQETFLLIDEFCTSINDFLKLNNCKLELIPFYNSLHFIKTLSNILEKYPNEAQKILVKNNFELFYSINNFISEFIQNKNLAYDSNLYAVNTSFSHLKENVKDSKIFNSSKTKLLNNQILFLYCFQIALNSIYLIWKSENDNKDAIKIALEYISKTHNQMINKEDFIGFYLDGFNPYFKINNKYLLKNIPKELMETINIDLKSHSKGKNKAYVRECRIVSFSLYLIIMKYQSLLINYEKSKSNDKDENSREINDRINLIRKAFEPLLNLSKKEIKFLVPNISKMKDNKNFEIMIEKEESRSKKFKEYNKNYYKYFSEKLKNKNCDMRIIEEEIENKFIKEDNDIRQTSINFLKTDNNSNYNNDLKTNVEKKEKIRKDSYDEYGDQKGVEEETNKNIKEPKLNININNNNVSKIDENEELDFENAKYPILCTKRDLILKNFGYFYYKYYFKNERFMKLKKLFFYLFNPKIKSNNYFGFEKTMKNKYPFITKNFSNNNSFYPKIFYRPYLDFFDQKFFSISHNYFNKELLDKKEEKKLHLENGHGLLNQNNFDLFKLQKSKEKLDEVSFKNTDLKNNDEAKILSLDPILNTIENKEKIDEIQKSNTSIDDSFIKKTNLLKSNTISTMKRHSKKNFTVNQNDNNFNAFTLSKKEDSANILLIECEQISPKTVNNGFLALKDNFLIYQVNTKFNKSKYQNNPSYLFSCNENDLEQNEKQIIIPYHYISQILYRKFLFYNIAIEIFLYNGKSYYFNLYHIHNINKFTKGIKEKIGKEKLVENPIEYFEKKKYSNKWQDGAITTLDYLLLINKFSDRSYNVLSHYLILPWLMKNNEDRYNIQNRRDFSIPALVESREELEKILKEDEWEGYICHFPNLYSNYMYANHFLFRIYPYINNQIKLQDEKFDEPGRQFHSLETTFLVFKENPQINMEVVPEFYFIPEFFLNLNHCFYGNFMKNGTCFLINNLGIEPNFHFLLEIINYHQLNINSEFFSSQINKWIDYVFGENQLSDKKDDINYFPYECYEILVKDKISKEFEKIKSMNRNRLRGEMNKQNKMENDLIKKDLIKEINKAISNIKDLLSKSYFYGHCPTQLFQKNHPTYSRKIEPKIYNLSNTNNIQIILKNERITLENKDFLYMGESSKGNYFYVICEHEILVFNKNLRYINHLSIKYISKIPKFFSTKYHSTDKYYNQLYNYKYLLFDIMDCKYFFIGGYMDNSLRIYTKEKDKEIMNSVYVETQIRCIRNSHNEQTFFTGHENGKIMKWRYDINSDNNQINIKKVNSLRCHRSSIKMLELNEKFECIVSIDNDEIVFIRKMYDFELLSYIKFNKYRKKVIDINIYNQIIIFTITKIKTEEIFIYTYTLNGLNLGKIPALLKLPISLIPNTEEMIIFSLSNIYCATVSFNEKASLVALSNNMELVGIDLSFQDEKDVAFKFNNDLHKFAAISFFYDSKNRVLFCLFSDGSLYRINFVKNV